LFFLLSLALAVLIGHQNKKTSIIAAKAPAAKVEEAKPAAPEAAAQPKSLSEQLPAEEPAPAPASESTVPPQPAPVPPAPAQTAPADTPAPAPAGDSVIPEEKSGQP
jgi:hypothetical protein